MDFEKIFDQYLYFNQLPTLQLHRHQGNIEYRWQTDVSDFSMPVPVTSDGKDLNLLVTDRWQSLSVESEFEVNTELSYIKVIWITDKAQTD